MIMLTDAIWFSEPRSATDRPVLAIIKGSERSLMIDGGNCPNHATSFLDELSRKGFAEPDFVATTHSHCDHIFGLSALNGIVLSNSVTSDRIRILNRLGWNDVEVAERVKSGQEHEMTALMLKEEVPGDRTNFTIRVPDVVYEQSIVVHLGGMSCCLEKIGGDHAADSTVVFVPEQRVAFIGDCLYLNGGDGVSRDALFGKLLGFGADLYIDSHELQPITRTQLESRYAEMKTGKP
jgi:glyoxylase-like metal-dependent hydrolase (beta-lactamase superfamily II)